MDDQDRSERVCFFTSQRCAIQRADRKVTRAPDQNQNREIVVLNQNTRYRINYDRTTRCITRGIAQAQTRLAARKASSWPRLCTRQKTGRQLQVTYDL